MIIRTQYARAALAVAAAGLLAACQASMASDMGDGMDSMTAASMDSDMSGNVMVGGQSMLPSRNIVENAVNSADHETLVAAVQAAGLVETLSGPGPFTVFAPTDAAFADLPEGTVDSLLQPENRDQLRTVLAYHVVPGDLDRADLMRRISQGGGQAVLEPVSGSTLIAEMNGPSNIIVRGNNGTVASIGTYDVEQSNDVIHSIDAVLLP